MTALVVTEDANVRSGSHALALLAIPLNGTLLDQLSDGPMRLAELRRPNDSAPESTVRARLRGLETDGLTTRRAHKRSPGMVDFALTTAGRDLLVVIAALEDWLGLAPEGPVAFGSAVAKSAIKALEGGWSSTITANLAGGSQSLSELSYSIADVGYPTLDRRLTAMRRAGQVRACPGESRGIPYEVTEWQIGRAHV